MAAIPRSLILVTFFLIVLTTGCRNSKPVAVTKTDSEATGKTPASSQPPSMLPGHDDKTKEIITELAMELAKEGFEHLGDRHSAHKTTPPTHGKTPSSPLTLPSLISDKNAGIIKSKGTATTFLTKAPSIPFSTTSKSFVPRPVNKTAKRGWGGLAQIALGLTLEYSNRHESTSNLLPSKPPHPSVDIPTFAPNQQPTTNARTDLTTLLPLDNQKRVIVLHNVDENLFLMRWLETMYDDFALTLFSKDNNFDVILAKELTKQFVDHLASDSSKLNRTIYPLYQDFMILLEQTEKLLQKTDAANIETEITQLTANLGAAYVKAATTAQQLAKESGWMAGEVGFQYSAAHTQKVLKLMEQGDVDGIVRLCEGFQTSRPRDPFLALALCELKVNQASSDPAKVLKYAIDCSRIARMIPPAKVYDPIRVYVLMKAADLAICSSEMEGKSWRSSVRNPKAEYALLLLDGCLNYTDDQFGDVRESKAVALACAGRLDEALKQALSIKSIMGNDPVYNYSLARIQCCRGQVTEAVGSLRLVLPACEAEDILMLKKDPCLANLRDRSPKEFADLVTPKWSWKIDFGNFFDDILLVNNSPFPLTNVILDAKIASAKQRWDQQLKAERVNPGETFKWVNVMSIPGSRYDTAFATLSCDQNK